MSAKILGRVRANARQLLWGTLGGIIIVTIFTPVAHADPHAVFYTTIGQQQLFFNVLAALDQADYVEPAQFRDALLQKRNQALQDASPQQGGITEDPIVRETRSDLSAVLSRPVTLEGDDAFTADQASKYSIEVARRAAVIDLVARVFCHRALGREGCETGARQIGKRDYGFITDPIEWKANAFTHGALGALFSGTDEDQTIRQEIKTNYENKNGFQIGRVHNPLVAELRTEAKKNSVTEKLLDQTIANTAVSMIPGLVNPETFTNLKVDNNGRVDVDPALLASGTTNTALAATGDDYSTLYTQKLGDVLALPRTLRSAAQAGSQNIQTIGATIEDQGEVADIKLLPRAKDDPYVCSDCPAKRKDDEADIESILPTVAVPAAGKVAQLYALANILGILDSTITYATPDTLAVPAGRVSLIERSALQQLDEDLLLEQQENQLAPIAAAPGDQQSRVAGTLDFKSTDFLQAPPVGVNPVIPHREHDLAHVVEALFPGFFGGEPCGCGLEAAANDYGTAILAKINRFSL